MELRDRFSEELKAAMKARDAARTSTLRMILARVKDVDIAARPKGVDRVPDDEVIAALRGMVKTRRESVDLYRQGQRQDLVDKEEAEIAVIEGFLPRQPDAAELEQAIAGVIAAMGASGIKDMNRVMSWLKSEYGGALDRGVAAPLVKAKLGG